MTYPPLGNSTGEIEMTLEVPIDWRLERKIYLFITWTYEGDTNATIYDEENARITWADTGEELTADELNTIVVAPDITLWDWIMDEIDKGAL
jgi:hypothetical protein